MSTPNALVCTGRPVDDHGQARGEPCGRRHPPRQVMAIVEHGDCERPELWDVRDETAAEHWQRARAAGWSIGHRPDHTLAVTCPACRRPDPATVRACRDLERGTGCAP